MNRRPLLSLFVALCVTFAPITRARAEERSQERTSASTSPPVILWRVSEPERQQLVPIHPRLLLPSTDHELERAPTTNAAMTDIRLSNGAKTAIIVTAIVVGVLIIIGVLALRGPGRHL